MERHELLLQWLAKVLEEGELLAAPIGQDQRKVYLVQFILALAEDFNKIKDSI